MSADVTVMTALVAQYAHRNGMPCDKSSARKAAEALWAAGFRMASTSTDEVQNDRLAALEKAVARIEGYMVIR